MSECKNCFHPCHCAEDKSLHAEIYGVCSCEKCNCKVSAEDESFENNGLVIDDTGECQSCQ